MSNPHKAPESGGEMKQGSFDGDGYWLDCIRRSGSNSAASGWQDIADFLQSGRADDRTLSGMMCALRALSQEAQRQLSERREAQRLARYRGRQ